jgi:hypothetical protein
MAIDLIGGMAVPWQRSPTAVAAKVERAGLTAVPANSILSTLAPASMFPRAEEWIVHGIVKRPDLSADVAYLLGFD